MLPVVRLWKLQSIWIVATTTTTTATTLNPITRKRSRRSPQQFKSRQTKIRKESIQRQISMEKQRHKEEHLRIISTIAKRIQHDYNFTPSLQLSICQNAQKVLKEMQQLEYFAKVNNLTFHDLTTGNILPASANLLLCLGLKFIPTQKHNFTQKDLDTTLLRFDQDIGLKTYFLGAPMDY
jgi:hypothetical protein